MSMQLPFRISWRETLIVVLGNISWLPLALIVFISLGNLGITPVGKFMQYNAQLYQSVSVDSIIEDPQWQFLLGRFQFFMGIVLEPAVSLVIALCCTAAQKDRKLLLTYFATIPIPAFQDLSAFYSHVRFISSVGLDLNDLIPLVSLLINVVVIYAGHKIILFGGALRKKKAIDAQSHSPDRERGE